MANHPNRNKVKNIDANPLPEEVIALRQKYGLTQSQASRLWMVSPATVQKWEAEEGTVSHRRVHPLMWWAMKRILEEEFK